MSDNSSTGSGGGGSDSSNSSVSDVNLNSSSEDDFEYEANLNKKKKKTKKKSGHTCIDYEQIDGEVKKRIDNGERMFNNTEDSTLLLASLAAHMSTESTKAEANALISQNLGRESGMIPGNRQENSEGTRLQPNVIEWYVLENNVKKIYGSARSSYHAAELWQEQGFKIPEQAFTSETGDKKHKARNLTDGSYKLFGLTIKRVDTAVTYDGNDFGWTEEGLAWAANQKVKTRPQGTTKFSSFFMHELNEELTGPKYVRVKGGEYCKDNEGKGYKEGEGPIMKYRVAKYNNSEGLLQPLSKGGLGQQRWNDKKADKGGVWRNVCYIETDISLDDYQDMTDPSCGTPSKPSAEYEQMRDALLPN